MIDPGCLSVVPVVLQEKGCNSLRVQLDRNQSRRRTSVFNAGQAFQLDLTALQRPTTITVDSDSEDPAATAQNAVSTGRPPVVPFAYREMTNSQLLEVRNCLGIVEVSEPPRGASESYPKRYHSWTDKERLVLMFAENFRRKFSQAYIQRKPLMLAPKNECDIQVSETDILIIASRGLTDELPL